MPAAPVEIQIKATGVDGVQRQLRLVKSEVENVGKATTEISHSALIGFSELARGVGKVAQAGELGAFAMREFTGAAFRLGEFLGPAGPLIPIIGMVGFALYEVFHKANDEMDKMKEHWHDTLDDMVNAGDHAKLMKQAKDLILGTPANYFQDGRDALQKRTDEEQAKLDALTAQRGGNPFAPKTLIKAIKDQQAIVDADNKALDDIKTKLAQVTEAILAVNNTPIELKGLDAMHIDALKDFTRVAQQSEYEGGVGGKYRFTNGTYGLRPGLINEQQPVGDWMHVGKIVAKAIPDNAFHDAEVESAKQLEKFKDNVSRNFAHSLGDGVGAGITAAFESGSVGAAFEAAGATMLAGLGSVFQDLGETYIEYSGIMEAFAAFLPDPFTAGWAGLAIGAALEALGAALHGVGQRHASGAYAGGGGAGAIAAQNSLAGQGNITVILPKGGSFLDPNNPDTMQDFVDALRKAFGDRLVTTAELG